MPDAPTPKEPRPSKRGLPCAHCGADLSLNWYGKGEMQYCGKYECKKVGGVAGVKRKAPALPDAEPKSKKSAEKQRLERGGGALLPLRADLVHVPDDLYAWQKEEKLIDGMMLNTDFSFKILNVRRDEASEWYPDHDACFSFLVNGVFEEAPGCPSRDLIDLDEKTGWMSNMIDNCHDLSVLRAAVRFMEQKSAHEADVALLRGTESKYVGYNGASGK